MTDVGYALSMDRLIYLAKALVEVLDQAETHHGGLLTVDMLRVKNELRLELSRWVAPK